MTVRRVFGSSRRLAANGSSTPRSCGLMAALPVSKEMSFGTLSLSWLSLVRLTSTPVPRVDCSMALRRSSMRLDHRLPPTPPTTPPMTAPVPTLPPVMPLSTAPAAAPMPAPLAVPCSRSLMLAQPVASRAAVAMAPRARVRWKVDGSWSNSWQCRAAAASCSSLLCDAPPRLSARAPGLPVGTSLQPRGSQVSNCSAARRA